MNTASDEVLHNMRQERTAREYAASFDPYSKLLIHKSLRRAFITTMVLGFVLTLSLVALGLHSPRAWWMVGLPITAVGLLLAMFPITETWVYAPWQTRPRRYERHQVER